MKKRGIFPSACMASFWVSVPFELFIQMLLKDRLHSLIETCKANSVDPYTYLVDLFRKLPTAKTVEEFEALLPWNLDALTD